MSDIYRSSFQRPPQYEDRVGHRLPPSMVRVERSASRALTALTLAAALVGAAFITIVAVRCAADDAAREDPAVPHHDAVH